MHLLHEYESTRSVVVCVGVESGAIMRVSGAGNAGRRKGPRGDLLAQVTTIMNYHYPVHAHDGHSNGCTVATCDAGVCEG